MRIRHVPYRAFGPYNRYRGLSGFGFAFGTPSQWQDKDCPVGGDWDTWCNCVFPAGSDLNTRCRSRPFPGGFVAPWTEVGAGARGLPKPGSLVASLTASGTQIISNLTGGVVQGPPQPPLAVATAPVQSGGVAVTTNTATTTKPADDESSIFGIPKTIAYVGGGVLVLGVLALTLGK